MPKSIEHFNLVHNTIMHEKLNQISVVRYEVAVLWISPSTDD